MTPPVDQPAAESAYPPDTLKVMHSARERTDLDGDDGVEILANTISLPKDGGLGAISKALEKLRAEAAQKLGNKSES